MASTQPCCGAIRCPRHEPMSSGTAPFAVVPTAGDETGATGTARAPGAGSLGALPRLLRAEPALAGLIGAADATVAVPEAAQAVATAALAALGDRGPILVVTPTGLDADRLGDDLACLLEADDEPGLAGALGGPVTVLPAWETLPFERVSPESETMGRRLAILHALTAEPDGDLPRPPRVIVTPVRALLQRIGPLAATGPLVAAARSTGRRRCPAAGLGREGLPARAPGGASGRVRRARRHRRCLPVDSGRAGARRPVGRRGRPADHVRRQRPALVAGPRRCTFLRLPRTGAHRRAARGSRTPDPAPALGYVGLGPAGPG